MPDSRVSEMKSLVKKGHTLEWIGGKFGVTRERMRQILIANGFSNRAFASTSREHGDEVRAMLKKLHEQNLPDSEIAKRMGITKSTVAFHREVLHLKSNGHLRICEICEQDFQSAGRATMCRKCNRKYGLHWTHLKWMAGRHPELLTAVQRMFSRNGASHV